jgi:tetratricopeptide (TPR) repeat protein
MFFFKLENYDEALKFINQAITIDEKSYKAYNIKGLCFLRKSMFKLVNLDEFQDAKLNFKQSLILNKYYYSAEFNLNYCRQMQL